MQGIFKNIFLVLLTAFFIFKPIISNAATKFIDPIYTVKTTKDIKYGQAVGYTGKSENLLLDIYEPVDTTNEKKPLIIFIHGGAFVAGSKSMYSQNANNLAKKGYVVSSIEYRLDKKHSAYSSLSSNLQKPIQMAKQDALMALHWLIANADLYKIDTSRVFIGGASAGAITSLYTAYGEEVDSKKIKAVYSIAGALLPEDLGIIDQSDPPTIMFHGSNDETVSYSMAKGTIDQLKSKKVVVETVIYQGEGHEIIDSKNNDIHLKLTQFLYKFVSTNSITSVPSPTITSTTLVPTKKLLIGDLNSDGSVNTLDIGELISNYLNGNSKADLNYDKIINGFDYFKIYEKINH